MDVEKKVKQGRKEGRHARVTVNSETVQYVSSRNSTIMNWFRQLHNGKRRPDALQYLK